jgi:hypothetical protein
MLTKSYWMFIAGLVLLFAVAVYARSTGLEGFVGSSASKTAKLTMFGVEWCPHCVSTAPEFDALGSSMTIGDTAVTLQRVNPEKDPQAAKGYSIDGYPTIILEKDGKQIKHSGPRTKDGFLQFLQQNLA